MFFNKILFSTILLSALTTIDLSAMKRVREEDILSNTLDMSTILDLGQKKTVWHKQYFPRPTTIDFHITNNNELSTPSTQQAMIRIPFNPTKTKIQTFFDNIKNNNIKDLKISLKTEINLNELEQSKGFVGNPLTCAIIHQKSDIVELFINNGANVNSKCPLNGFCPLHDVKDLKTTQLLLDNGANVNVQRSQDGLTPLMHKASEGKTEIIKELILHGANITLENNYGEPASEYAWDYVASLNYPDTLVPIVKQLTKIVGSEKHARKVITNNFTTRFGHNVFSSLTKQQIHGSKK